MSAAVAGASAENRPQTDEENAGQRIIKHEKDSDIKDYAETTMNELLGWYGYDKLDSRGLNLKTLARPYPATSSSSSSPARADDDASEEDTGLSTSPVGDNESVPHGSSGGTTIVCAWCLKMGLKLFTLKTASGETKEFCSEPCFNQCRRAAFKKNRVCNWCRHVRHTVNYVDFQDGDDQLQFCSDKCLNQYKMQIFCKETQAYLQMNPHLQEETSKNTASSKLITPDLWLRDCHESANGGMSHSGDETSSKPGDKDELEDLSTTSKSEHGSTNQVYLPQREIHKNLPIPTKDHVLERCNNLTSYLGDDKEKNDRKKRHHEMRENSRKRQRISSSRHKASYHPEAPPAHLSSAHSSLNFQSQNSVYPATAPLPLPLRSKSPVGVNPPAAHSKTFNPHPGLTGSLLHPGLPPPPPLLNNDFYHSSFNPPMFPPQQHQLDAMIRMQAGFSPNAPPSTPNFFHESLLPFFRNSSLPNPSAVPHPNTMMLPYPIFVPLPVPIPIPIPLSNFLPKDKQTTDNTSIKSSAEGKEQDSKNTSKVYCETANNSKSKTCDETQNVSSSKCLVTNSDSDEQKLLKKTKQ